MKKIVFIIVSLCLMPQVVFAHAFGQLYNLPVPFWLYLYGGAAAIVVSFLVIGYFFNQTGRAEYRSINFANLNFSFVTVLKYLTLILFLLTIATGIFGENNSGMNFNMTFFWIIFALGLTYLVALIGNIYAFINPIKTLASTLGKSQEGIINYPKWLGYYPALILYFIFIWLELIGQTDPFKLSITLIIYAAINLLGVITFGRQAWFTYGEFFSVFFRLIGKISPIEYRAGKLYFRAPFVGLLKETAEHFSLLIFILFMLSSTAFDGFRETVVWLLYYIDNFEATFMNWFGIKAYDTFQTVGLLLSPFAFLAVYLILITLAKFFTKSPQSVKDLSLQFVFSLVPIAFVYNIAHYFTLIFTEAPNIFRLISDPFGFGWNIFGSSDYLPQAILNANFVWHSQVAFILLGHIVSVYLAHVVAMQIFPSSKKAILSQLPMLVLMVIYTMTGLWILSQPITI
jgi:hypothetical protein